MGGNKTLLACYLTHRGQLRHYASRIVGDPSLAEDMVQEAWLRCHREHPDNPLKYLYRVIRNLAVDKRRQTAREDRHFVRMENRGLQAIAADLPASDIEVAGREELARLMEALRELPDITRRAIILYRLDGLKLREIADILGISITRVHGLVAQGLEHCRQSSNPAE